jgi:hypothetical protein
MRMQQRRKPAATWTSTNEQLLDGELGIESDTGKWKVGDGSTLWNAIPYQPSNAGINAAITAAVNNLIDGAPGALDTLNELAAALGDNASYAASITTALAAKANTSALGTAAAAATTDFDAAGAAAAAQAYAIQRGNHTGTQSADTVTDGSTNKAYTAAEKTKLSGVATSATANSPDATLLARGNHTGTQTAATVSDFQSTVSANSDVAANTAVRHSHTNSAALALVPLNNYAATTDPTVSSDTGAGYAPGSTWINTATAAAYECLTAASGAAVWRRLTTDVQIFTTAGSNTWTRPAWASTVFVQMIGGGAGGGSGRRVVSGTAASGGAGGGGGAYNQTTLPASSCGATETVTVGAGGAGGAAVTADNTNGNTGGNGSTPPSGPRSVSPERAAAAGRPAPTRRWRRRIGFANGGRRLRELRSRGRFRWCRYCPSRPVAAAVAAVSPPHPRSLPGPPAGFRVYNSSTAGAPVARPMVRQAGTVPRTPPSGSSSPAPLAAAARRVSSPLGEAAARSHLRRWRRRWRRVPERRQLRCWRCWRHRHRRRHHPLKGHPLWHRP